MNLNFFRKEKKNNIKELFLYNMKLLVLWLSVVMIWRWIWNLLDTYFLPQYFILSNILTIVLWILFMLILEYDLEALWVGDDE